MPTSGAAKNSFWILLLSILLTSTVLSQVVTLPSSNQNLQSQKQEEAPSPNFDNTRDNGIHVANHSRAVGSHTVQAGSGLKVYNSCRLPKSFSLSKYKLSLHTRK
jgi:hypothetical protein